MDDAARQPAISIMRGTYDPWIPRGVYPDVVRISTPRNPETPPDLRRVLTIDFHRVVSGRPSLAQTFGALAIERSPAVDHYSLLRERPFESHVVRVSVSRGMIRSDFGDIEDRRRRPAIDPNESRGVHRAKAIGA